MILRTVCILQLLRICFLLVLHISVKNVFRKIPYQMQNHNDFLAAQVPSFKVFVFTPRYLLETTPSWGFIY